MSFEQLGPKYPKNSFLVNGETESVNPVILVTAGIRRGRRPAASARLGPCPWEL